MKRFGLFLILGLLVIAVMGVSCGKKPPPPVEEPVDTTPVEPVDTTPVVEEPPPPPPPTLKESQFMTVYFDFDKYNLRTDAKTALDKNYQLLKEYTSAIIRLEGHCDERGTVEYNLSLGEKRAKAAQDYLIGLGIDPGRISIRSYGKEFPIDPGHNEAAWAKNRRVEFKVISQ